MPVKTCKVPFRKPDGCFYAVEVEATTLYEAVVIALSSLTPHEIHQSVEGDTKVKVQILEPGPSQVVAIADVQRWLDRPSFDAAELAAKRQLRRLLAS
jgi:hypothetical protein